MMASPPRYRPLGSSRDFGRTAVDDGLDHNLEGFSKCLGSLTTIRRGGPRRGGEGQKCGHQGDRCDTARPQSFTVLVHGFLQLTAQRDLQDATYHVSLSCEG